MNKELMEKLQVVLRLDTIYKLFTFDERINIRGYMQGWQWAILPKKAKILLHFVEDRNYYPPTLRVGQDRLLYVDEVLAEDYVKKNKEFAKYLKRLL